jgi:single-strand DNA-binding protein
MNVISISGSLGRDAEIKNLQSGDVICNFSIADSMGRDKGTIWWNCSLYGKRGESLAQYLTKGQAVTVNGIVTEREWTDKDGVIRKSIEVRVNDVALQGGKKEAEPKPERYVEPVAEEDLPF